MLRLNPIHFDKIWGYEDWIASVHPSGFQENFAAAAGKDYPLLVKIIQADASLSVQVHPDDEQAMRLEGEGERGKTECWYVLDAEDDARLVYGLKKDVRMEDVSAAIKAGTLERYLNFVNVKKGDFVFIPAGTVHAICGGIRLLEVQQSCDITYRLYDYNRGRELHVEKSLQVIKSGGLLSVRPFSGDFSCRYFALRKSGLPETGAGKDRLLFVLGAEKNAGISSGKDEFALRAEEIFFLKAGETPSLRGKAEFLEISAT